MVRIITKAQKLWKNLKAGLLGGKTVKQLKLLGEGEGGSENVATGGGGVIGSVGATVDFLGSGSADGTKEHVEMLFLWSVTKFQGRLQIMRDLYAHHDQAQEGLGDESVDQQVRGRLNLLCYRYPVSVDRGKKTGPL